MDMVLDSSSYLLGSVLDNELGTESGNEWV